MSIRRRQIAARIHRYGTKTDDTPEGRIAAKVMFGDSRLGKYIRGQMKRVARARAQRLQQIDVDALA